MIVDIIVALEATNSVPNKVRLLKSYDSPELREILFLTYNPFINYGFSKHAFADDYIPPIENRKGLTPPEQALLSSASGKTDWLLQDVSRSSKLKHIHGTMSVWGGLLYYILTKDLRCGIGPKIINQAFPKLIPTFQLQLAKEVPAEKLSYPAYVETKYDGVRLVGIVNGGDVEIRTRNGKVPDLPVLAKELSRLPNGVYDGELIYTPTGQNESRTTVSGLVNSAMHGGKVSENALWFMVFDFVPLDDFTKQECMLPYVQRRKWLHENLNGLDSDYIVQTGHSIAHSAEEVSTSFQKHLALGHEGIIVKARNSHYNFKRSKDWAKFKAIKTADLTCIGLELGTPGSQFDDAIGALLCEGVVEGKKIYVKVGSGLTHEQRFGNHSDFCNKTVEVKYNEVIPGFKSGTWTLFLPRFVEVRIDK